MATPKFIFQGIRPDNDHENAIKDLLSLPGTTSVILSVAYARESGVSRIAEKLSLHGNHATAFVGIRNGVTSAQGLAALLKTGILLYVVDTGSPATIFHPKTYLAAGNRIARVISGSANLTFAGLNDNVEASTIIELDLSDQRDQNYLTDVKSALDSLRTNHPRHVIRITRKRELIDLLKQGRVEDERIVRPQRVGASQPTVSRERLDRIRLHVRNRRRALVARPEARPKPRQASQDLRLLWVSKGLTERDLDIPSGQTTNRTGSMLFKKGETEGIDQRTYFRETVFANLTWRQDDTPGKRHLERAEADFEIIIKGVSYGTYRLRLTHNTRTNSRAYEQRNSMTQVHWDTARNIIAQRDLLDRQMRLYRKPENREFVLEIV